MPEFKDLQFALNKISQNDENLKQTIRKNLNRPFIVLMEYIPGFAVTSMGRDRARAVFHPDVLQKKPAEQGVKGWDGAAEQ